MNKPFGTTRTEDLKTLRFHMSVASEQTFTYLKDQAQCLHVLNLINAELNRRGEQY
jgi:hypothetical protein